LAIVTLLVLLERLARRRQRFAAQAQRQRRMTPIRLTGTASLIAVMVCTVPILVGFVAPASLLLDRAVARLTSAGLPHGFGDALWHTLVLASIAAVIAVLIGLVIAYAVRITRTPGVALLARAAGLGYAVPGTIFAVGLMAPLAGFDNAVDAL